MGVTSHLFGAGAADHVDDLRHGGAADDGVVHQQHGAPLKHHRHRVQLAPHAQLPRAARTCRHMSATHAPWAFFDQIARPMWGPVEPVLYL